MPSGHLDTGGTLPALDLHGNLVCAAQGVRWYILRRHDGHPPSQARVATKPIDPFGHVRGLATSSADPWKEVFPPDLTIFRVMKSTHFERRRRSVSIAIRSARCKGSALCMSADCSHDLDGFRKRRSSIRTRMCTRWTCPRYRKPGIVRPLTHPSMTTSRRSTKITSHLGFWPLPASTVTTMTISWRLCAAANGFGLPSLSIQGPM